MTRMSSVHLSRSPKQYILYITIGSQVVSAPFAWQYITLSQTVIDSPSSTFQNVVRGVVEMSQPPCQIIN